MKTIYSKQLYTLTLQNNYIHNRKTTIYKRELCTPPSPARVCISAGLHPGPAPLLPQPVLHTLTRRDGAEVFSAVAGVSGLPPPRLAAFTALMHLWHAGPVREGRAWRCLSPSLGAQPPRFNCFEGDRQLRAGVLCGGQGYRQLRAGVLCGGQRRREDVWSRQCPRERQEGDGEHPHNLPGQ